MNSVSLEYLLQEAHLAGQDQMKPSLQEPLAEESVFVINSRPDVQLTMKTCQLPGISIVEWEGTADASFRLTHQEEKHTGVVYLNFLLKGQLHTQSYGMGQPYNVYQYKHNIMYAPPQNSSTTSLKGFTQSFHVKLDTDYFLRLIPVTEGQVLPLLEKIEQNEPYQVSQQMMSAQAQQLEVVRAIQQCPLKGAFRKLYLEAKAMELLSLQFTQIQGHSREEKPLRPADVQKLQQVKVYLDENYLAPVTLSQLVRPFGLNNFKLKTGFRQLYQTTVIDYVYQRRMDLARELLRTGLLNVSQVSELVGYQYPQHFSAAYKKRFGSNPNLLLKRSA